MTFVHFTAAIPLLAMFLQKVFISIVNTWVGRLGRGGSFTPLHQNFAKVHFYQLKVILKRKKTVKNYTLELLTPASNV